MSQLLHEQCVCSSEGYCARYKREMTGRLRSICKGDGVHPADRVRYLTELRSRAGVAPPVCPFLKRRVRNPDGSILRRSCPSG